LLFPAGHFSAKPLKLRNPSIQALLGKHRELKFNHIEPTAVLQRVMKTKEIENLLRFVGAEGFIKGGLLQAVAISSASALLSRFLIPPALGLSLKYSMPADDMTTYCHQFTPDNTCKLVVL